MMDLRILTLLVVVFGVVYSHTTPRNDEDNFIKLFGMITKLQEHVTKLGNQQQELKGKVQNLQETLTEQYDQISLQLQADEVGITNYYYGCDNSTTMPPSQPPVTKAQDCTQLYSNGFTWEGVFVVQPDNSDHLAVYCQEGWTVLQKRTDDSINYTKNMEEYGRGFGSINGEHWLGLNAMNKLTEQGSYTIRFELEDFNGETAWAEYSNFHVDASPYYTLMFNKGSYRGTAGDALSHNHGMKFSTYDVDQDEHSESCSTQIWTDDSSFGGGGWWFDNCGNTITTGMKYGISGSIMWIDWKNSFVALKSSIIKIKRV